MLDLQDTPTGPRRRNRRSEWWIVGGVLAALAGVLVYAASDILDAPVDGQQPAAKPQAASEPETKVKPPAVDRLIDDNLIDDDGKTLWASPTHGPPLDFTYLPPESEIILAVRPAALFKHAEGAKVLAAIGPTGKHGVEVISRTTGLKLHEIEQLIVGWRMVSNYGWAYTQIAYVRSGIDQNELRARLEQHITESYHDRTFVFAGDNVYFHWTESDRLVEGTRQMFAEFFPSDPLLPRDLQRLVRQTDSLRQVTLIVRPHFLLGDQHELFSGSMRPLRQPLSEILGPDVAAASLSMNWEENFFIELVAVPTLDSSPQKTSAQLSQEINKLPRQIENFVLGLQSSPYSRRLVARLPEMSRRLATFTRNGFDRDAAVLRCYLPVAAGHNLLMGAELALAEADGGERTGARPVAEATSPGGIVEKLRAKTSLRFDREELEAALDILSQDLGVPIEIRGPDLQADGITRNQLFAIDMRDRTGEEILVEILRRANPDKLASGPADPRQKLVYVLGPEAIVITTRTRASERGEPLPEVFQEAR